MFDDGFAQGDVTGQCNYGNAAPRDRGLHGNFQNAGHLFGVGNQLTVVAALREKIFRMRLLKVAAANFLTWNLRGDGKNWNTAAVTIVKSIDQMQIAWTATSRADRETAGQMRFRTGGEGGRFFMPHVNPLDSFFFANRVSDSVEGVTTDSVDSLHSGLRESLDEQSGHAFLCHVI